MLVVYPNVQRPILKIRRASSTIWGIHWCDKPNKPVSPEMGGIKYGELKDWSFTIGLHWLATRIFLTYSRKIDENPSSLIFHSSVQQPEGIVPFNST